MINNLNYIILKTIEEDSVLRMAFERNLISSGALAKHIIKQNPDKNLVQESVRSAVRRFKKDAKNSAKILSGAHKVLGNSYLHVRNNMVKIEFKKDESTLQLINKSFKINEIYNNDIFRLIKGHSVLHAIVEEINLDKILPLFEGKIMRSTKGLCEFIVVMPFESRDTPGILLTLINELSMNNINIAEAFSCGDEINLIVSEQDNQRAFNLLSSLLKRCKIAA